jgi:hypothetical protein
MAKGRGFSSSPKGLPATPLPSSKLFRPEALRHKFSLVLPTAYHFSAENLKINLWLIDARWVRTKWVLKCGYITCPLRKSLRHLTSRNFARCRPCELRMSSFGHELKNQGASDCRGASTDNKSTNAVGTVYLAGLIVWETI